VAHAAYGWAIKDRVSAVRWGATSPEGRVEGWVGCLAALGVSLHGLVWRRRWADWRQAEIRGLEAHCQAIGSPREGQGAGCRRQPGAWLQEMGALFRGACRVDPGILPGPCHRLRGVEVAQGDDGTHGMMRREATRCPLEGRGLGRRRARAKPPADCVIAGCVALLQPGRGGSGICDRWVSVVPAGMAGQTLVTLRETPASRRGVQPQGVAGIVGRDRSTVGLAGQAPWSGGSDLGPAGESERRPRQGRPRRRLGVPSRRGWLPGFAVPAHMGPGVQPVPGGGMEGAARGERETGEDRRVHVSHAGFHPACFLALPDRTRGHDHAAVGGAVARRRMAPRGFPQRALEARGGERIHHALLGDPATPRTRVLMAGHKGLQSVGDRARHIPHAALTPPHDQATPLAVRVSHGDGAARTPLPLGPRAGSTGEREQGSLPPGSDRVHRGLDARRAAGQARCTEALEPRRGRSGMVLQHAEHRRCEGIEGAAA
jgi:hypothetical protein